MNDDRGTALSPRFYEGPANTDGGVSQQRRYYTYELGSELAAGYAVNLMFTIDRPAREVWPYLKDFNLWQNSRDHYYSGVVGDLEGKTFRLGTQPNEPGPHQYRVLKVIPGHLIVLEQPGEWEGGAQPHDGFSVFMLNEHDGKTLVTIIMQHSIRTKSKSDEEALSYWRRMESELQHKWRDHFIPELKKRIYERK